ncbi:hypothetical protein CLCR_00142 [Cladophialophora carrionii]|uniref:Uncharacterized protein n=1 Tax=Cladophialophora carrionii TaxID=86049 RepID=A0A1C1C6A1_9EURO|nr:hypothetical protein CLCR_00142 [Cladophialophora carrionii]
MPANETPSSHIRSGRRPRFRQAGPPLTHVRDDEHGVDQARPKQWLSLGVSNKLCKEEFQERNGFRDTTGHSVLDARVISVSSEFQLSGRTVTTEKSSQHPSPNPRGSQPLDSKETTDDLAGTSETDGKLFAAD